MIIFFFYSKYFAKLYTNDIHLIYNTGVKKGAFAMAEKTTGLYIRMNPEKKEKAEAILKQLGLNSATAINMFYDQIILRKGIPFRVEIPNAWDNLDYMNKYEYAQMLDEKLNRLAQQDESLGELARRADLAKKKENKDN